MKKLLVVAAFLAGAAFLAWRAKAPTVAKGPVRLEFRLAEHAPAPGTSIVRSEGGDEAHVHAATELANADIAAVERLGGDGVLIRLTPSGAEKLKRVSSGNVGKRLAILLDGRLLAAPVIGAPIPGGEAQLAGLKTDDAARLLAAFPKP